MIRTARSLVLWVAGLAVFSAGASVFLALAVRGKRKASRAFLRRWCRLTLRAAGIRVEVEGEFPAGEEGCVVVAPHVNLFDPLVLGSVIPADYRGVELETHFRWPVYGQVIRAVGNIPLSHSSPVRSREHIRRAEDVLRRGAGLVVLPEGHRTRSGRRGTFGLWAFRLAARADVPVVPVAFRGAFARHRTGSFHINPGTWRVRIHPVVRPFGQDRRDVELLRERVEEMIDTSGDQNGENTG